MSKHTPMPWAVVIEGSRCSIDCTSGDRIATAHHPFPFAADDRERDANARLIAAAPEQHEANKTSLCVLCVLLNANDWHPNMRKDIEIAIAMNRAAIAKATGEA